MWKSGSALGFSIEAETQEIRGDYNKELRVWEALGLGTTVTCPHPMLSFLETPVQSRAAQPGRDIPRQESRKAGRTQWPPGLMFTDVDLVHPSRMPVAGPLLVEKPASVLLPGPCANRCHGAGQGRPLGTETQRPQKARGKSESLQSSWDPEGTAFRGLHTDKDQS